MSRTLPGRNANTGMRPDSEIIARSRDRPDRFGELFTRHATTVHRYVARRAGRETADELLSETFLVAFQRRDRFDPSWDTARPWLLGIATVLLRAHARREAQHLRAMAHGAESEQGDGGIHRVSERTDAARDVRRLGGALRSMPAADRDVLLLHAWGDLTYEQIAAVLGIPVGTVRSRLNRARTTLRRQAGTTLDLDKEAHHGRLDAPQGA